MNLYGNLTSPLYGFYEIIPFPFAPSRNIKLRCEYASKCQTVNPVVVCLNPLVDTSRRIHIRLHAIFDPVQ